MPVYPVKDGRGRGYEAVVNENNQIGTDGDGILRDSLANSAFGAAVDDANIDANDTMLLIRNELDKPFAVDKVFIHGGDVGGEFWIHVVTANFTLAGTANVPFNLNTHSGSKGASSLSAKSDETGNTRGTVIHRQQVAINTNADIDFEGVILGKGVALGVDQISEEAAGRVEIFGHYME